MQHIKSIFELWSLTFNALCWWSLKKRKERRGGKRKKALPFEILILIRIFMPCFYVIYCCRMSNAHNPLTLSVYVKTWEGSSNLFIVFMFFKGSKNDWWRIITLIVEEFINSHTHHHGQRRFWIYEHAHDIMTQWKIMINILSRHEDRFHIQIDYFNEVKFSLIKIKNSKLAFFSITSVLIFECKLNYKCRSCWCRESKVTLIMKSLFLAN